MLFEAGHAISTFNSRGWIGLLDVPTAVVVTGLCFRSPAADGSGDRRRDCLTPTTVIQRGRGYILWPRSSRSISTSRSGRLAPRSDANATEDRRIHRGHGSFGSRPDGKSVRKQRARTSWTLGVGTEGTVRKLSGIDADMLYGETPTWHMHIGGLMVLDPSTMVGGFDFDAARRLVALLAADLAPLRERLLEVPFGLDRPSWVDDPALDLDAHLHRIALPPPGGSRELAMLAGALASTKLDRSRPLWEMWFIEGLAHGYVAILAKIHHACADGVGGALLMGRLLTIEPRPAPTEMPPPSTGETIPSGVRMLAGAVPSLATLPLRTARTLGRTATSAWNLARRPRAEGEVPSAMPFRSPHTSLNHPVTSRRSVAFTDVPLADAKGVSHAFSATLNDVVLALCAGALRRYLAGRANYPAPRSSRPYPSRCADEDAVASFGNMVSGWFADLATDVDDPVERVLAIRDAAPTAKRLYESGAEDVVMDWAASRPLRCGRPGFVSTSGRACPSASRRSSTCSFPTFPVHPCRSTPAKRESSPSTRSARCSMPSDSTSPCSATETRSTSES